MFLASGPAWSVVGGPSGAAASIGTLARGRRLHIYIIIQIVDKRSTLSNDEKFITYAISVYLFKIAI